MRIQEDLNNANPEYPYEEGVAKILEEIRSLLSIQDYVVIAIAGPLIDDTSVGKTFLSIHLSKLCQEQGWATLTADHPDSIPHRQFVTPNESGSTPPKYIIILGALGSPSPATIDRADVVARFKIGQDTDVAEAGKIANLPISGIDLRVFIHRPDKPSKDGDRMWASIIINNDKATD